MVIITKMLNQMFLHACFIMCTFAAIRLVIIPPKSKIVHCLFHVLFVTLITGKAIDQGCANRTKLMVYSIGFSCNIASEDVSFINI